MKFGATYKIVSALLIL